MSHPVRKILLAFSEFVFLALLTLVAPILVYLDISIIDEALHEISMTEIGQEVLLVASCSIFLLHAVRKPESRGFLVLVAAFFLVMLIRELDYIFDAIRHGFWKWLVLPTVVAAITYVNMRCRNTIVGPMVAFLGTKAYYFICFGLIMTVVFSQYFGSGNLIWEHVLASGSAWVVKTALQEGLELLGYILITYGAVTFHRHERMVQFPAEVGNDEGMEPQSPKSASGF